LSRDEESGSIGVSLMDVPPGITADQLLTGQWFGLGSTLDEDTAGLMNEHYHLLAKDHKSNEQKKRQEQIEDTLRTRLGGFEDTSLERSVRTVTSGVIKDKGWDVRKLTPSQRSEMAKRVREIATEKTKTGS
jgi:hypothetical protein